VMVGLPQAGLPDDPPILKTLGRDADTEFGVYADVLVGGRIARHDAVVVIRNAGHVTLRTAGDTDQAFLRDMLYQSLHVPAGHAPLSRDVLSRPEIAKYVEGWGRAGDIGLVAVDLDGREAIGAAWLRLFTGADRGFGYVDDRTPELGIAVVPHRRGEGIGTALLTGLLDAARERYDAVSLSVSADNPAVRLYERLGFARVAGHRGSLTMLKSIGPRP
jgi:ribosomal protein S18 acetylase RimI-like enzyme